MLVLSEFAGPTAELPQAVSCNPWDLEGLAAAIGHRARLEEDDRRRRIAEWQATVHKHDVFGWVSQELARSNHLNRE